MESTLFARVQHYAAHRDYDTAIFIAEQLLASCTHSSAAPQHRPHQPTSIAHLVANLLPAAFSSAAPPPPSPLLHSTVLLLSRLYFDSGPVGIPKAYHLLSSTLFTFTSPLHSSPLESQHRHLLSLSAFHLQRLQEAERFLLPLLPSPSFPLHPSAPSIFHLLASICERSARTQQAIDYHRMALALDPFLWSSIAALAHLGVAVDAKDVAAFQAEDVHAAAAAAAARSKASDSTHLHIEPPASASYASYPSSAWYTPAVAPAPAAASKAQSATRSLAPSLATATPSTGSMPLPLSAHNSSLPLTLPSPSPSTAKPKSRPTIAPASSPPHSRSNSLSLSSPRPIIAGVKRVTGQQKLPFPSIKDRKSKDKAKPIEGHHIRTRSVLAGAGVSAVKKKLSDVVEIELGTEGGVTWAGEGEEEERRDGKQDVVVDDAHEEEVEAVREQASAEEQLLESLQRSADSFTTLFRTLISAYTALCQYQPTICLSFLSSVPFTHAQTPLVLSCIGRAHFDLLDYPASIAVFQRLHSAYPHHLQSMDLYSTALWQCKKDVLLSALSHSLLSLSALSPISCVVIGNTFSLQRDHDTALRFFRRAIQLDDSYAYAHTLCGHELVCMEDYTAALASYRQAMARDARQYNAWYGLGHVLYQQEKFDSALYHFRQALAINPQSSLLHVYIAMTHIAMQRLDDAERVLHAALELEGAAPNPQVWYQLANVHALKKEWERALEMCERVEELVWREASVWVLKGRVLKRLGRVEEAMRCFVNAMDLDPKDNNAVKATLDKMLTYSNRQPAGAAVAAQLDDDDEDLDDQGF